MKFRSIVFALVASATTAVAQAQTYSNAAAITIPNSGPATPYPSIINVVGGPASINNVTVTLTNMSHSFSSDVQVLLVGPQFQKVLLLSDTGGGADFANNTLSFNDAGITFSEPANNIFQPTGGNPGNFPGPAPAGPYGAALSAFNGTNSNGAWLLYVWDDAGGDSGSIAGGWSITFNTAPTGGTPAPTSNILNYQGRLVNGSTPVNNPVDVRVTFYRNGGTSTDLGLGPVVFNNVPVTNGLFTLNIDVGNAFYDDKEYFLGFEVRNPAGSGSFVPLTGRQRITPAASAQWASAAGTSSRVDSPNRTITGLVSTDDNGNVAIAGPAQQIGGGTFIVNGRTGTGTNFGGMYVNTPSATGLPFYGYAANGLVSFYHYYDPGTSSFRLSNNVIFKNSGDVGIGIEPVAGFKLSVAGSIRCTSLTQTSSVRYKTDVAPISDVLDQFTQLRPVSYVWNDQAPTDVRGQKTLGLIAEEVAALFPDAVQLDAQGRPDGIDYSRLTALSIQAVKELRAREQEKDARLRALEARLEALEKAAK